jgi:ferredoxin
MIKKTPYKRLSKRDSCYGCGMCASVCKKNVLEMQLNKSGFYMPVAVKAQYCTSCGMCVKVCPYDNENRPQFETPLVSYAGWSKDINIRKFCSSGGVAYELSKYAINKGANVCTVKYNSQKQMAEHAIVCSVDNLKECIGSKYIQSYTTEGFSKIKFADKNLIIGTPCQIDAWRQYLNIVKKEDNYLLIDFFCHGVPSMFMWRKYLKENVDKIGNKSYITWRDKRDGWHSSWNISAYTDSNIFILEPHYRSSSKKDTDLFYTMFLSNCCLNKACYKACKYKLYNSSADIRLGDLWGSICTDNEEGVNGILAFTENGIKALENSNIHLIKHQATDVAEGQMDKPIKKPWNYSLFILLMKSSISLSTIRKMIVAEEIIKYQFSKLSKLI